MCDVREGVHQKDYVLLLVSNRGRESGQSWHRHFSQDRLMSHFVHCPLSKEPHKRGDNARRYNHIERLCEIWWEVVCGKSP